MQKQNVISTHKYLDVYNAIRSDILLKVYPDNSLLPTESHLMEQYGVSRNTVRRAIKMLQDEGFVSTRQGSGSIVTAAESLIEAPSRNVPPWSGASASVEYQVTPTRIQISRPAFDRVSAPEKVAEAFQLPAGTQLCRSQRIWKMDDVPYNYMVQYINPSIIPDASDHLDKDIRIYKVLAEHYGLRQQRVEEHITCLNAGFIEAGLLNVEVGAALLFTTRLAFCEKGVFEYAEFYGHPKYTGYVMHMRDDQQFRW